MGDKQVGQTFQIMQFSILCSLCQVRNVEMLAPAGVRAAYCNTDLT